MNKIRGLKTRKTLLTNYQALIGVSNIVDKIIIATLIALVLLFAVWTRDGIGTGGKTLAIVFCITLGLLFLNRRGYPREAGLSLFLVLILAFTYLAIHEDGIYNVPFIYFPILLISAGIIFGRPMIPLFTAIIIGITIILFTLDRMGVIVPFGGVVEWKPDFFAIVLIILIATSAILQLVMGTIETNLEQMVRSEQLIKKTYELTLEGWAKALELSGRETPGHSKRIVIMVKEFSDSLRLPEKVKEEIVTGALVHDIGKMGIPDSILLKPGKLSDEEFEVSKQHVSLAQKIFEDVPYIQAAIDILSCHHEQWDGQGYPNHLEGKKIPYSARIFTIVDNWDSLTNRQVYREAWPEEETCDYLREQAGKKFDREIVEAFLNFISKKRGGKNNG